MFAAFAPEGRAFLYTLRRLPPTISSPLRERVGHGTRTTSAEQVYGGNLRVPQRGEAFAYTRCRFAPKRGSKTRVG